MIIEEIEIMIIETNMVNKTEEEEKIEEEIHNNMKDKIE